MRSKQQSLHGAAVSAPPEEPVLGESPPPGPAKPRRAARASIPARPRPALGDRLLSGARVLLGLAVVVGASAAVAYSLHRYALTTTRFGIHKVELAGEKRFSPEEVRALGGIELGKNLFSFDTRAAETRLLESPWISAAHVVRKLPETLVVTIEEREAAAIAVLGERPFLVTPDGEPFKQLGPDDPSDLPLLTGVSTSEWARDQVGAKERLRTGVDLVRQYQKLHVARIYPPEEVNLAASGYTVLTVGRQGIALELGRPPFARKLTMGAEVIEKLGVKGKTPGLVFLDNEAHPERVVVRMR